MKMNGDYVFSGSKEQVWDMLQDPQILKLALPGTKSLDMVSDDEYEAAMEVKIGPVSGLFTGKVKISNKDLYKKFDISVEGKGASGFGKGSGVVHLTPQDGGTFMTYDMDLTVGGKIAGVGQRLIDNVAKSLSKQALESLDNSLKAKTNGEEFVAKTTNEVALNVAKDVVSQSVSKKRIGIVVLLALAAALGFYIKAY